MTTPTLVKDSWQLWTRAYLLVVSRLQKPHGVRILLDDGTEIPCRCSYQGVLASGEVLWTAAPETGQTVPAAHLDGLEVDDLPFGAVLHLAAKLEGLECGSCGEMTFEPEDAREGFCGACRGRRARQR